MNTQGWIRGLTVYNSTIEKFANYVSDTISKEFEFETNIHDYGNSYLFHFEEYRIEMLKTDILNLQKQGPYAQDKYLLEGLKKQGLNFNCHKSQYVEYCYGVVNSKTIEAQE